MAEELAGLAPFLKWAGGKRWLVSRHPELFPREAERLIEPFLGSGAIFFHMRPRQALLNDKNPQLIDAYRAIQENWKNVRRHLKQHHARHSTEHYYRVRDSVPRAEASKAARLIYLNRTCWNGLYRVNKDGHFNVPIGTKQHVVLPTDDFRAVSSLLKNAELCSGDFEATVDRATVGDFLFVDPPYTVRHNHNGFVKYNEAIFSWADQVRLAEAVRRAKSRGARILVTNADHPSIHELYEGVGSLTRLSRASVIAGKASARGKYGEVVVSC